MEKELSLKDWSVPEDSLLWQLYNSSGSKWLEISQLLKGRTDNAIRNRFQYMKRELETDVKKFAGHNKNSFQTHGQMQRGKKHFYFSGESRDQSVKVMEHFAIESLKGLDNVAREQYVFGPMRSADPSGEICRRCGLFAPSVQTGRTLCVTTGWYYDLLSVSYSLPIAYLIQTSPSSTYEQVGAMLALESRHTVVVIYSEGAYL